MAESTPPSTDAMSPNVIIGGTEAVTAEPADDVSVGSSSLPEFIVVWKNSSKIAWEGSAQNATFANHPDLINYIKRPRGHLAVDKTPNQSVTDRMEFDVKHQGLSDPSSAALSVGSRYKHTGPNGNSMFFEVWLTIQSGGVAKCELVSSLKPATGHSGTNLVVYDGNETDGFYVCHAQQVGEGRPGTIDVRVLIRPRDPQEPWPPKEPESAPKRTTPEFTLNWKNTSNIGLPGGLDFQNTTFRSDLIVWLKQPEGYLASNDKDPPQVPGSTTTNSAAFYIKDDPQHSPETRYIAFCYRHPYYGIFFGVRIAIPPTGPRWYEINSSHDAKWLRPGPSGWGLTYASRRDKGMYTCQTVPGQGAGSVLNLDIRILDRRPSDPGPDWDP